MVNEIHGSLQFSFKKIPSVSVEGGAKVKYVDKDIDLHEYYRLEWYSDCQLEGDIPTTIEEAVEATKKLPQGITDQNDGKGVPIEFEFTSIEDLKKIFKVKSFKKGSCALCRTKVVLIIQS